MNDYYINYLKSSKCFINLTVSLKQMEEIKASISVFKDIFNSNVSGNVIDEFKDRIDALDKKVDIYISRIKAIIEKLQENAKKGDSVLSTWITKKNNNEDYQKPYGGVGFVKDDKKITDTLYKKVRDVSIDENNRIRITVSVYIYRVIEVLSTKEVESRNTLNKDSEYYTIDFNGNLT